MYRYVYENYFYTKYVFSIGMEANDRGNCRQWHIGTLIVHMRVQYIRYILGILFSHSRFSIQIGKRTSFCSFPLFPLLT